jgi:hypothetical protein
MGKKVNGGEKGVRVKDGIMGKGGKRVRIKGGKKGVRVKGGKRGEGYLPFFPSFSHPLPYPISPSLTLTHYPILNLTPLP